MTDEETIPKMPGSATEVALEDIDAARSTQAVLTNRMIASNLSNGLRIAFGEKWREDGVTTFSSCVFMSFEDALALRDLIDRQLFIAGFVVGSEQSGDAGRN